MAPKYWSDCVTLILKLMVLLMFGFSTSSTKQCTPKKAERDGIVIRNISMMLCQLKCVEGGQHVSVNYNIETLTCRLSRVEPKEKKNEGHVILAGELSHVPTTPCSSSMCSFGQRCLKTPYGRAVCVQDEKRNDPDESPQQKVDKQETFANSPLHEACRKGGLNQVRDILSQGFVDINSRDEKHGKTPLMVAAQEGHCSVFEFLIRKGANKSDVDNDGKNVLHWACKGGHAGMVECVPPQYGIKASGRPVLIDVAYVGSTDVFEFLECTGSNVSQVDNVGNNVLHAACYGGKLDMVKYIVSQCCVEINSRNKFGNTPLMAAASESNKDILEFLLHMGANVSMVNNQSFDALHYALFHGHPPMVKFLVLQGKVDINRSYSGRITPLIWAAFRGNKNGFEFLRKMGANVSVVDDKGQNILHYASKGGCEEMVKHILLKNLVDINSRNKDGETAAMIAKRDRKLKVYDFLVSRGCLVM